MPQEVIAITPEQFTTLIDAIKHPIPQIQPLDSAAYDAVRSHAAIRNDLRTVFGVPDSKPR